MPFILENIDRYVIYIRNNALYIEDKYLHPAEKKKMVDDDNKKKAG